MTVTGDPHQVVDVLAHGLPREVLEALMLAIGEELLKTKELPAE